MKRIIFSVLASLLAITFLTSMHPAGEEIIRKEETPPLTAEAIFKIEQYGLYSSDVVSRRATENAAVGYSNLVENVQFLKKTKRVQGKLGTEFGLQWQIVADEPGFVEVEEVWIFPEPMMNYKLQTFTELRLTEYVYTNTNWLAGFTFEEEYEIIKGTWTYQVFYKGRKVLEQKFRVK